jgi:WhiB family redox-sensing transcriptional regulator
LFYNERGESIAAAAALCRGCEVREDCLHHALTHGERFGVWGGFSVRGRQGMRLPRRAS